MNARTEAVSREWGTWNSMIVNHFCTTLRGGASAAAQRLHRSLRQSGVDSRFWHSSQERALAADELIRPWTWPSASTWTGRIGESFTHAKRRLWWQWTRWRQISGRPPGFEFYSYARRPVDTRYDAVKMPGDLIHLHWVARWLDMPSFFASLPENQPVLWTLHDMNPFTGGCHFSSGCERYVSKCGDCHQLARPAEHDLSRQQLEMKREAVAGKNLHIAAPSRWLLDAARRSEILSSARSFQHIPYGLDTRTLAPQDRSVSRRLFRLPDDAFVLGFGADSLVNRRKGLLELLAALERVRSTAPLVVLVFGGGELPSPLRGGLRMESVGYIREPEKLAHVFSAMDLFALPSLEDNLPQAGLESLACGTPVVAFAAGGIPEFVVPGETGLLAKSGDVDGLASRIQWCLDHPTNLLPMRGSARRLAEVRFQDWGEASRYTQLYRDLLAGRAPMEKASAA